MSRTSTPRGRFLPFVAVLVPAFVLAASPASAGAHTHAHLSGSWVDGVPCVITDAKPSVFHPGVVLGTCVGSSVWSGALVGVTHYKTHGTTDLLTGDGRARLKETFIGVDSATGKSGTIHLAGTVVQDGATVRMVVKERVVSGTGAFTGLKGHLRYAGVDTSVVGGAGHYAGVVSQG